MPRVQSPTVSTAARLDPPSWFSVRAETGVPAARLTPEPPDDADLVHQVRDAPQVAAYRTYGVQIMQGALGAPEPSGEFAEVATEMSTTRAVALDLAMEVSCFPVQLVEPSEGLALAARWVMCRPLGCVMDARGRRLQLVRELPHVYAVIDVAASLAGGRNGGKG